MLGRSRHDRGAGADRGAGTTPGRAWFAPRNGRSIPGSYLLREKATQSWRAASRGRSTQRTRLRVPRDHPPPRPLIRLVDHLITTYHRPRHLPRRPSVDSAHQRPILRAWLETGTHAAHCSIDRVHRGITLKDVGRWRAGVNIGLVDRHLPTTCWTSYNSAPRRARADQHRPLYGSNNRRRQYWFDPLAGWRYAPTWLVDTTQLDDAPDARPAAQLIYAAGDSGARCSSTASCGQRPARRRTIRRRAARGAGDQGQRAEPRLEPPQRGKLANFRTA